VTGAGSFNRTGVCVRGRSRSIFPGVARAASLTGIRPPPPRLPIRPRARSCREKIPPGSVDSLRQSRPEPVWLWSVSCGGFPPGRNTKRRHEDHDQSRRTREPDSFRAFDARCHPSRFFKFFEILDDVFGILVPVLRPQAIMRFTIATSPPESACSGSRGWTDHARLLGDCEI